MFRVLRRDCYTCDGLPTLPVGEKAIIGGVQTRDVDGLLPLPIEENAKSWINFRAPRNCSRWTFPPACGGKVCLSAACGRLSPLPVEEKAISWTWCALAVGFPPLPGEEKTISWTWCVLEIGFSPCLSRKRLSHGLLQAV